MSCGWRGAVRRPLLEHAALIHEATSGEILGAAIEVHRVLGPGLLESAYELCMSHELSRRGVEHVRQIPLPIVYKGERLDAGSRIDLLVRESVIVELKSVAAIEPVHEARLLTYMKLARKPLGLLINFDVAVIKNGLRRRVLSEYLSERSDFDPNSASSASPR